MPGIDIQDLPNWSTEQLRETLKNQSYRAAWPAIGHVLQERKNDAEAAHRESEKNAWDTLQQRVNDIESKIPRPKPEWTTWSFWLSVIAAILAGIALLRDYFDVTGKRAPAHDRGQPAIEPTPQSQSATSEQAPQIGASHESRKSLPPAPTNALTEDTLMPRAAKEQNATETPTEHAQELKK